MTVLWLSFFYIGVTNPQLSFSINVNFTKLSYLIYLFANLYLLICGFRKENNTTMFEVLIVFSILIVIGSLIFIISIF